jgi:hypothetical protein
MSTFLYVFSCLVLLALVGLSRVKFVYHVHRFPKVSRVEAKGSRGRVSSERGPVELSGLRSTQKDLESALINLGTSKGEARKATARAINQGHADFDTLLRRAIQEAA